MFFRLRMSKRQLGWKEIQDPVHGLIELHPLCVSIIDTYEFQRLRNISQCGLAHLVFPSACHSRFEHCLGVYHLACCILERLEGTKIEEADKCAVKMEDEDKPVVKIEEADKLAVKIAALCHDIGHGPFSHLWEHFLTKVGSKFKHEEISVKLLNYLIEKNNLFKQFEKYGLNEEKRELIGRLIFGKPMPELDDPQKRFLFEIVCHDVTGVDVDKWDYIMRDSHHFAVRIEQDFQRILYYSSVIKGPDGSTHIAYREKVCQSILHMFQSRANLHHSCYQHRVNKNIETMVIDALVLVDEKYRVKLETGEEYKLSESHTNMEAYLKLSDSLYYQLLNTSDRELTEGKNIIRRIVTRKLYAIISFNVLKEYNCSLKKKLKDGVEEMGRRFNQDLRFSIIDPNTDREKLKKIFCLDRKNSLVDFPGSLTPGKTSVMLMSTSCAEDIDPQLMKDMQDTFCDMLN